MHDTTATLPNLYRDLPSIGLLLDYLPDEAAEFGRNAVLAVAREILAERRTALSLGEVTEITLSAIVAEARAALHLTRQPSLRPVFNLTGTVLHTNLGRALLPEEAIRAMLTAATNFTNLEYDIDEGSRGERDDHISQLLCALTGAEACTVVNNNAAAVMLTLNALASGQSVAVSRGELVEIGGAFRIPDIMARSGCQLVEVGTTNRTHLKDYEAAIAGGTALLMKVHTSNFKIEGFTKEVGYKQLADLAKEANIPLVVDLGSGSLLHFAALGDEPEPIVSDVIKQGANLVTFSGDKLLGGPQCGLIAGDIELIRKINRNPMKRALRVDKVTLAALRSVLKLYCEERYHQIPTYRYLSRHADSIAGVVDAVRPALLEALPSNYRVETVSCDSQVGSGALPTIGLASVGLTVSALDSREDRSGQIAAAFRSLPIPVIGSQKERAFRMDMRCLDDVDKFNEQLGQLRL